MIWTAQKGMHDGIYLTVQWCHHQRELRMPQLCLLRAAVRERTCNNPKQKPKQNPSSVHVKYLNMCDAHSKKHYFCTIYGALEFSSSIQTSIRNGWIVFMSDCFSFSHMVYACMHKSAADAQRCRIFSLLYSNDWTCSNRSNHLKTKCCLFFISSWKWAQRYSEIYWLH